MTLSRVSATTIDNAVDQWHKRLHCCSEMSGHLLRTFAVTLRLELCLIQAGWLADTWILRCVTSFSVRCVTKLHNKFFRFIVHNIHACVLLCNKRNITVCCKFPQQICSKFGSSCQILFKLVNIWLSYRENKKGELFWNTVYRAHRAVIFAIAQLSCSHLL